MLNQNRNTRPWVALPTALSLILTPAVPLVSAPVPAFAATTQAQSEVQAAETQPAQGTWPKWFETTSGGTIVMYAPQVNSWDGQKDMVFRAAVSYTYKESQKPDLGTVKVDAKTKVNVEDRLVIFSDLTVSESSFPTLARDKVQEVTTELQDAMPEQDRILSLDRVLEGVDKSQILPKNLEGVKADPPQIYSSTTPAILVSFDGEPIWSPIKDVDLRFAVNTNWDVFEHTPTKAFYLRRDENWLQASDVKGPWAPAGKLPESFRKLPDDDNWKEVKANVPGKRPFREKRTDGVCQLRAGGTDPSGRAGEIRAGGGDPTFLGEQHRKRPFSPRPDRFLLLSGGGPMVLVHHARRPVDVRFARPA